MHWESAWRKRLEKAPESESELRRYDAGMKGCVRQAVTGGACLRHLQDPKLCHTRQSDSRRLLAAQPQLAADSTARVT